MCRTSTNIAFRRFLVFLAISIALLMITANSEGADLTLQLRQEFKPEIEIDLTKTGLERAQLRLSEGDVPGCRTEIIRYFLANAPAGSLSAWPVPDDAMERADGLLKNEYTLGKHRAYILGDDLAWNENPDNLNNWAFLLNAFDFLGNLTYAYRITHDTRYLEKGKALIRDFIEDNLDASRLPSNYSWFDHSVAYRSIYLIDFWRSYVEWSERDERFGSLFMDLLWRQAAYLANDEYYSKTTNHGVFSDVALFRIALAFPEFKDSSKWIDLVMTRIERQVRDNFTPDGVHQEYAPAYHILTTKLLCQFLQDAHSAGISAKFTELNTRLRTIIDYIPYVFHPDGTVSLLGDTYLESADVMLEELADRNPAVRYVYSNGKEGRAPMEASKAFLEGQIFVMRSGWGEERPYGEESCLIADFGPFGNAHQHFDFMTFELSARGARWISDLGPFTYTPGPKRKYMLSANAHNCVVPYIKLRSKAEINDIAAKHERRYRTAKLKLKRITGKYPPEEQVAAYEELLREYSDVLEDDIRILLAYTYQQIAGGEKEAKAQLVKIINKGPSGEYFKAASEMYATLNVSTIETATGEQQQGTSADEAASVPIDDTDGELAAHARDDSYYMQTKTLNKTLRASRAVVPDPAQTPVIDHWISEESFDYLEGHFQYAQFFEHARSILFIKPHCFLITDRIATTRNCIVKDYFHMPPAVQAQRSKEGYLLSVGDSLRCMVHEISVPPFRISRIIEGSTDPEYQGWYGGSYNLIEPAPVLEITIPLKKGYVALSHLIVPTGADALEGYKVRVKNAERWNPLGNIPLEMTIEEPGYRTDVYYRPSSNFRHPESKRLAEEPEIRIVRKKL